VLGRSAGLRDEYPASRERSKAAVLQIHDQLVKEPVNAVLLDIGDGLPVDAGRAFVGTHQLPRPLHDVPAMDLS
jgi:hypothetical protein